MSTLKSMVIAALFLAGLITGTQAVACPTMFFISGYQPYSWSGQSVYTPVSPGGFSPGNGGWWGGGQPFLFSDGTDTITVKIVWTDLFDSGDEIRIGYEIRSWENQALVGKYFDFLLSANINWEPAKIYGEWFDPLNYFTSQANGFVVGPNGTMLDVNNLTSSWFPDPWPNPGTGKIDFSVDYGATPEPSPLLLLGTGLMGLFAILLRRQKDCV